MPPRAGNTPHVAERREAIPRRRVTPAQEVLALPLPGPVLADPARGLDPIRAQLTIGHAQKNRGFAIGKSNRSRAVTGDRRASDFLSFWQAGRTVLRGHSPYLLLGALPAVADRLTFEPFVYPAPAAFAMRIAP